MGDSGLQTIPAPISTPGKIYDSIRSEMVGAMVAL